VEIPVVADADTGYDGPSNIERTVREHVQAGVAAIHLEDQVAPKRCGQMADIRLVDAVEATALTSADLQDPVKWSRKRPPRLEKNQSGAWCLSLVERKRILLEHIYAVDIDPQAVEVAKLSLLIVVLEDQSGPGLQEQLAVFKARVLPDLDSNVRCGNSLVGTDFLSDDELVSSAEAPITQPFGWSTLRTGKFQAVVGNPPWLMAGHELPPSVLDYLKARYASYTGKADLYYLFLERSLGVLAKGGRVGMVVPNKMYTTRAATGLRELLSHRVGVPLRIASPGTTPACFCSSAPHWLAR